MSGSRDYRERFLLASRRRSGTAAEPGEAGVSARSKSSNPKAKRSSANSAAQYRLGAYVRLSPSDEIREEGSLVSHPQRIQDFVKFRNSQSGEWGEIVEWYTDKEYSGGNMNRPAFLKMVQDIKRGHINGVIVTELSRLSRDVKDFCQFWEFLKRHSATFFSLKESFDTSTPIGEMMVIQCISFAQFERKNIIARIKDGSRARAERGLSNGGQRILGFDPDPLKRCHLVVNQEEATVVRHLFEKFLELGSLAKLRVYLNASGSRTKSFVTRQGRQSGGMPWTDTGIYRLLTNLALLGKREINKVNRGVNPEELREIDRYKVVDAHWPAILDEEIFWRAQEAMLSNARFGKSHKHVYRLTGLVHCGVCGDMLVGKSATGRTGKYYYYGHNRKFRAVNDTHKQRCPLERIPAIRLEEAAVGRLVELAGNRKLLAQLAKDSNQEAGGRELELSRMIAVKEQERRNLQRLIENLMMSLAERPEGLSLPSVYGKIAEMEAQRDQVAGAMAQLKDEHQGRSESVIDLEHVLKIFRLFSRKFPERPAHEQRDILRDVVYRITVQ